MSKLPQISAGLQASLAARRTHLAWSVTFTRRDSQVLRFCSGTRSKTIGGNLFQANPGFTVSSLTCSRGTNIDTLELTVIASSAVEQLDFLTGRWFGARVEFNQFDWATPTDLFLPWPTYRVADVQHRDGRSFVLQLRDIRMLWRQDFTLTTGKTCQNRLGDARCGVNLATWTEAFEVTAVTNRRTFTIDLAEAADWATEGLLSFGDGPYEDLPLWVADHATGGVVTLAEALVQDIVVGQTGTIIAGCLGRREDCRDKFDNILRMRAPGLDAKTVEQLTEEE